MAVAPDPSVIAALEAAVAADPANAALRCHLATLLLGAGKAREALVHVERVLSSAPDNVEALGIAASAAEIAGDHSKAAAWRRLHDALGGAGPAGLRGPHANRSGTGPQRDTAAPATTGGGQAETGGHGGAMGDRPGPGDDLSGTRPDGPRGPGAPEARELAEDHAGGPGVDWDGELAALLGEEAGKRVTLEDVAGLDAVKSRLQTAFLGPMRNPELRRLFGADLRGGLLLWGPPGCGKTFLARAVAGELGASFFSVGLHDVLDMWLGNSEKRLHAVFELARRRTPAVLFFDEVDAIGHSRSALERHAGRNVVAQLLAEMDGMGPSNEGLFLIGATNQPWDVDPALRRPGRFDKSILVLPPDARARESVLRYHLRERPVEEIDLGPVVATTDGFSGADLRLVCEEAAQLAMADAVRTGVVRPIGAADLMSSVRAMRPSTVAWLDMARNFVTFANGAGDYDELADYLRERGKRRR